MPLGAHDGKRSPGSHWRSLRCPETWAWIWEIVPHLTWCPLKTENKDDKICIDHLFSSWLIPCFPYNKEIVICAMKGRKRRPRKTRHWSTPPRCHPGRQSSWSVPVSSPGIGAASLEKVHLRYLFRKFWHLIIIYTCVLLLRMMIRDISSKTEWKLNIYASQRTCVF